MSWRRPLGWLLLPAWTLVVWVPRVRNIWTDDELSAGGQAVRTVWAVIFIVLAVWVAYQGARRSPRQDRGMQALVVWTIGFWAVRGTQIALADHDASFIVVHSLLALVSIGLALWSWPRGADTRLARDASLADHG